MTRLTAVRGDITAEVVDVIVNAANRAMRGGGGVDGAIHRAGGQAILEDCIARFPRGLATGDAGWTTAGRLPARWVVHTVGPNHTAGERDPALLASCYRRSIEVAGELGARSIAFPLVSAGVYGWPRDEAILIAVEAIAAAATATATIDEVRLVAFDDATHRRITAALATAPAVRILQAVRVLHERGYHRVRIHPGMSASGMYWRTQAGDLADPRAQVAYTTGAVNEFLGRHVDALTPRAELADAMLAAMPTLEPLADDPAYVAWYAGLLARVEQTYGRPISYADYFDDSLGWEIGWCTDDRYPAPPPR
ncbi:O-acetyl-ADP-ribose deacetylase [Microbacterium sp. 2FI]|uniref:O-acetyl-ADP-ribose deacetylase n=1 Tax=Microbacterium sp. 2FI TaxID=2502193 RepID=UPI0010F878AE|nr:O-acetyl-ADP-ribose deacetylase [Microbacterium sp. 2FI]